MGAAAMSPQAPAGYDIRQKARSLQPGEVVELTVDCPQPLKDLTCHVLERTFPFFSEEGSRQWRGLIGIDLDIKPGVYTVRLTATRQDGRSDKLQHRLVVKKKDFPTRRLTVDEKFVNPPAEVLERIAAESKRVSGIFVAVTPERLWSGRFGVPVQAQPNSSFGKRSILNGQPRSPHSGTDFDAEAGAPVTAPNGGKVVLAADLYYSGNTVILDHGLGLYSYFAHLSKIELEERANVTKGDLVGLVGATGRVTGPHLHWSVRLVGTRVDPLSLIAALQH